MKLILHIGTHKTATTTVQKVFANNRRNLLRLGVWYPTYSELIPGMSDHYAHLDLAKGLMSDSKKFTPETVALFFKRLYERAASLSDVATILLSAEPFYRGRMPGESPYWQSREQYISKLRELVLFDDVEVALVLRRQDDYLESLYNEHVKTTRYSKDIWTFLSDYRSRFEYGRQIRLWSKYFADLKIFVFEDLIRSGNVTRAFLEAVLGLRGVVLEDMAQESNVSLPIDLIEFKRLLNQTSLSRSELSDVVSIFEVVARTRAEGGRSGFVSRLSVEDCQRVLEEFRDDNAWINEMFFAARPEGLFPAEIKSRSVMQELSLASCAQIFAEVARIDLTPRKR